jgi:hypothetical protein
MSTKVHVVNADGSTAALDTTAFAEEAHLQALLERNPALLAGDQMFAGQELRFLLVKREAPVSATSGEALRWRLDHLFIDQHGTPTLVEVKRSSDPRIRREVIGQVIEYAANSAKSWATGTMRKWFQDTHKSEAKIEELFDPTLELQEDGGDSRTSNSANRIDKFWQRADESLRSGQIRLILVADELPRHLIRMIEFLNERFATIEVVGVEVRQYRDGQLNILVPRVVGLTTGAWEKRRRTDSERTDWDEESFADEILKRHGKAAEAAVSELMAWCREHRVKIGFTSAKSGSFVPEIPLDDKIVWPIAMNVDGRVKLQLGHLANRGGGMKPTEAREELLRRLNTILKEPIGLDRVGMQPSFSLTELGSSSAISEFVKIMTWVKERVQQG